MRATSATRSRNGWAATALGPILQVLDAPFNDLSRGCTAEYIEIMATISGTLALDAGDRHTGQLLP